MSKVASSGSGRRTVGFGWTVSMAVLMAFTSAIVAQDERAPRRARPPKWDHVPPGIFFDDAFREGLRGRRPATLRGTESPTTAVVQPEDDSATRVDQNSNVTQWSDLISAASIEDELKTIKQRTDEALRSEGYFKVQGHKALRRHLGTAAILWAIIDQFDAHVRWKSDAAIARDRFARAARNSKAGSSQVYREVLQRRQDLSSLIRGGRLGGTATTAPLVWPDVADRKLIMQRLETSDQEVLSHSVASESSLETNRIRLLRESELVAALAHVLIQEGMEDADDPEYDEICAELKQAALKLQKSARQDDAAAARRAHGELKNSCVRCHELYRA